MTQLATTFFSKGLNSTVQLARGTGLSYQNTGVAIYNSTEIDRWAVSDFISVEYIINAEFGNNERETINATLVAMPGQASITIYGRTSLKRQLLNVRASATNSYATLIVEPASIATQGTIVTFFGNYAKSSKLLVPINSSATANITSWSLATSATSLAITVTTSSVVGNIFVGQRVSNSNLPAIATVTSWNSTTGALVIGGFQPTTIAAQTNQQIIFNTGPRQLASITNTIEPTRNFGSFIVPTQSTVNATSNEDYVNLIPGYGMNITTNSANKQITFTNTGFVQVVVAGQNMLDATVINSPALTVVAGNNITLTTNNLTNSLTIASQGVTVTTQDLTSTKALAFTVIGSGSIATSTVGGVITISSTINPFVKFNDSSGNSAAATLTSNGFTFTTGLGISATVSPSLYSLTIANTGVLSIGNLVGAISATQLVNVVNSSSTYVAVTPPAVALGYFLSSR
jgi:hypothetical protein